MKCKGCRSTDSIHVKIGFQENKYGKRVIFEVCEKCSDSSVGVSSYRDAAGNTISFPTDGFKNNYTDALGQAVTSKKQFSDILKRDGLRQNSGHFTGKKSFGPIRRPIKV